MHFASCQDAQTAASSSRWDRGVAKHFGTGDILSPRKPRKSIDGSGCGFALHPYQNWHMQVCGRPRSPTWQCRSAQCGEDGHLGWRSVRAMSESHAQRLQYCQESRNPWMRKPS